MVGRLDTNLEIPRTDGQATKGWIHKKCNLQDVEDISSQFQECCLNFCQRIRAFWIWLNLYFFNLLSKILFSKSTFQ